MNEEDSALLGCVKTALKSKYGDIAKDVIAELEKPIKIVYDSHIDSHAQIEPIYENPYKIEGYDIKIKCSVLPIETKKNLVFHELLHIFTIKF